MASLPVRASSSLFLLSLSLSVGAACTDDPPGPPATITVSTARTPELIAFRDGTGADWQVPAATTPGTYEFVVHGPYVVTVVCDGGARIGTEQLALTPDDERELDMPCGQWGPGPLAVTGTMVQPGAVALGTRSTMSSTPSWQVKLTTTSGPHDLIATSSDRIAIRRDQVFAADVTNLAIDLAQEGAALVPVAFTAPNTTATEELYTLVELETATTSSGRVYFGAAPAARVAPTAILREADRQATSLSAAERGSDSHRFTKRSYRVGDPTAFTLPEPLAGQLQSAAGKVVATWSALPAHDRLVLSAFGATVNDPARYHELEISQRFLAATGDTRAALETDLPGYLPAWRVDLGKQHLLSVAAYHSEAGEDRGSVISRVEDGL
jgi:hypothetical protein